MSTEETIPTDEMRDQPEGQGSEAKGQSPKNGGQGPGVRGQGECCGAGGACQGGSCEPDTAALDAKIIELTEQLQRTVAESQNMKKRFERDREELGAFAGSAVLLALLPILDALDRAAEHLPPELAENDWARGVVHVRANLEKAFAVLGVERVGAEGDAYDPALHEAIAKSDGAVDTIVSVFESGYRYNGKLLRPAKVVVGAPPSDIPAAS